MTDENVINCKRIKLSEPEFDNSFINELNDDCLREIFSYLSIADIKHVEKVCKRWEGLCEESWKTVESLECKGSVWYLMGNYFDRKLYELTCVNDLKKILQSCGKFIKYFRLFSRHTSDSAIFITCLLTTVPELCENLQDIEIDSIHSPSAIEICSIANSCKHLQRLTLTRIDREWEKNLAELLSNNKNLKYFSLGHDSSSNNMTGEFLQYLPADVIEEIHLKRCDNLKPHFFISAMKQLSNLRSFTYGPNGFFDNSMMEVIGQKKTLIKLSTTCASYKSSKSINYLGNLTNLEELFLSCNYQLQDDALINISNNCKQLKLLEISFCHSITNRGIASVAKLKQLEILKMDGLFEVSDESIGKLPHSLKILICSICEKVKDDGVMRLIRKAPNLAQLNLYLCSITNSTIETAIDVTSKRTNDIVLEMCVDETNTNLFEITRKSPFLKIY